MSDIFADELAKKCNIFDEVVLRKAKDLQTRLNSLQNVHCSESCKYVICLDIASTIVSSGSIMSRTDAVTYAGVRKSVYLKLYNTISKLLNLDKVYTMRELAMLLGVSEIYKDAEKLLDVYKNNHKLITNAEWEHPMFICAALSAACKREKIKLNEAKLIEISRVKKAELQKLINDFTVKEAEKITDNNPKPVKKKEPTRGIKKIKLIENGEDKEISDNKSLDEDYESWKKRMLEE